MQKWEYLFIRSTNERHSDGRSLQEVLLINGDKELFDGPPLKVDVANRFG
jgi:hypothetical protein